MKKKRWLLILTGSILGALGGYCYWEIFGLRGKDEGANTITSDISFSMALSIALIVILTLGRQIEN